MIGTDVGHAGQAHHSIMTNVSTRSNTRPMFDFVPGTPRVYRGSTRPATGCTLPVEMFFPEEEYPTRAVEQELEQLGVLCSVLPDLVPAYALQNSSNALNDTEGKRLAGFSMKIAALLLSSFEEVRSVWTPLCSVLLSCNAGCLLTVL